jgi:hypothetical protein
LILNKKYTYKGEWKMIEKELILVDLQKQMHEAEDQNVKTVIAEMPRDTENLVELTSFLLKRDY